MSLPDYDKQKPPRDWLNIGYAKRTESGKMIRIDILGDPKKGEHNQYFYFFLSDFEAYMKGQRSNIPVKKFLGYQRWKERQPSKP